MNKKVLLILSDGFRPDALTASGHPFVSELMKISSYSLEAETVSPSVTLPCHMSLFHSVTPERHGIVTNLYVPQVRPVTGLCEQLSISGKSCAFFYNWEELRDLARPGSLAYSYFASQEKLGFKCTNELVTQEALKWIGSEKPDFAFVYLGYTDCEGHRSGWMGPEYLEACRFSLDEIKRLIETFREEYTILFTADHGGHDRTHGSEEACDMKIPFFLIDPDFAAGPVHEAIRITDLAPTIAELMGVLPSPQWEGQSLCRLFPAG